MENISLKACVLISLAALPIMVTVAKAGELQRSPPAAAPLALRPGLRVGPAAIFPPMSITTAPMSITGGALPATPNAQQFSPIILTTAPMTILGGALPVGAVTFKPVTVTTAPFSITGK